MKTVILGGAGYVGGRLAAHLKAQGHHVTVTTRRPHAPAWLRVDAVVQADGTDREILKRCFSGADMVFHLAGADEIAAARDPLGALRMGGELTWNVHEALAAAGGPPLIFLSTIHVYGARSQGRVNEETPPSPAHPYGLARYLGENVTQVFRSRGARALCVRMSNAFGAPADADVRRWSLVFNDLCLQAVVNGTLVLKTPGTQRRNFIALEDVVRALEFLAQRTEAWPADGVIHLGSEMNLRIKDVAALVARRAEGVLGGRPAIEAPAGDAPTDHDMDFSIERLRNAGFRWTNPADREIEDTLRLCRAAKDLHGAALWTRCRPDLFPEAGR